MSASALPLVIQALFPAESLNVGYPFFRKGLKPDPARADYQAVNDWWCGQLALLAYLDDEAIKRLLAGAGMRLSSALVRDGDLRAIVAGLGDSVYVAVRGSVFPAPFSQDVVAYIDAMRDWSLDVQYSLVPLEEPLCLHAQGRVHRGFQSGLRRLHPLVQAELDQFPNARKVVFTGHSLGGALAILLAMTLRLPPGATASIVSFGTPRLGDDRLIKSIQPEHRCYVHGEDRVADLPPKPWSFITWLAAGYDDYPRRIALSHINKNDTSLKNAAALIGPALKPPSPTDAAARPLMPPDNFLVDLAVGRFIDHAMVLYAEQCGRGI